MSDAGSGGLGLIGTLLVVFVVLKLTHLISWSWWWVLSPLWIAFALVIVLLIIGGFLYLVFDITFGKRRRR